MSLPELGGGDSCTFDEYSSKRVGVRVAAFGRHLLGRIFTRFQESLRGFDTCCLDPCCRSFPHFSKEQSRKVPRTLSCKRGQFLDRHLREYRRAKVSFGVCASSTRRRVIESMLSRTC